MGQAEQTKWGLQEWNQNYEWQDWGTLNDCSGSLHGKNQLEVDLFYPHAKIKLTVNLFWIYINDLFLGEKRIYDF